MKGITDRKLLEDFLRDGGSLVPVMGRARITVTRADGSVEESVVKNQVTAAGLNLLAQKGMANDVGSSFLYIAVGTQTAAGSLDSVTTGIGEVSRKTASIATNSLETMIAVMTWAGAADSITSLDLRTAGMVNHADSGEGTFMNMVNSVATILADSDFLKVQLEVRVGSH